jgi:3-hydroxyisobutyrate dehydrogenase
MASPDGHAQTDTQEGQRLRPEPPGAERPHIHRVGFAGLGIMGGPMAANLVRAGLEVSVYTRTREKAERFAAEHGARAAATPAEAAAEADAFVSIVPDAPQVEAVLFGDHGAAAALPGRAMVVDMSTIAPTASRRIAERLAPRPYVEAPVSGSKPKAEDGTLTIMAGGAPEDFARARLLFDVMGELIVHVGPIGHGQMAKLLTNLMGAVNAAALAETVRTAKAAGLDRDAFLEVAAGSAGASAMLNLKGPLMFEERFEPALFKLEHMLKDVRHCIDEARALGIELQLGALAETLYARADQMGHGGEDFAAVYAAF